MSIIFAINNILKTIQGENDSNLEVKDIHIKEIAKLYDDLDPSSIMELLLSNIYLHNEIGLKILAACKLNLEEKILILKQVNGIENRTHPEVISRFIDEIVDSILKNTSIDEIIRKFETLSNISDLFDMIILCMGRRLIEKGQFKYTIKICQQQNQGCNTELAVAYLLYKIYKKNPNLVYKIISNNIETISENTIYVLSNLVDGISNIESRNDCFSNLDETN